jgi:uncharacterized protein
MSQAALSFNVIPQISGVSAHEWNALAGTDCPFLRHEFLAALEVSGCASARSGWTPSHLCIRDAEQRLVAAAPSYLKSHSYGEFVFDFAWAQAYARHGLAYYPKRVIAVPFSPITSTRLLMSAAHPVQQAEVIEALSTWASTQSVSSVHALFLNEAERMGFASADWLLRSDVQFHWHNQGFGNFDEHLSRFTAEKRKKVLRERRRCQEQGIHFKRLRGSELSAQQRDAVYALHQINFHRHGHEPYLNRACFEKLTQSLGDSMLVVLALKGEAIVATAICFFSKTVLYGRYWGARDDYHSLHFETCYHQGIEFCIEQGLERFEPGTQGEHKVSRGFSPSLTWSAHYIADPRFRQALTGYLQQEAPAVANYAAEIDEHTPFRKVR